MPALLRSAISRRMGRNSSHRPSPPSSPSYSHGRKVIAGGRQGARRHSLSVRATQFLDDGDASDGSPRVGFVDDDDESRSPTGRMRDDDVDDDEPDVDGDVIDIVRSSSSAPMDGSSIPVVVASRPKSLVSVLVNDDCVGIVVEEEEEVGEQLEGRGGGGGQDVIDERDLEIDDDMARAGNEAILLVYGHNVNLYTNVFQLPSNYASFARLDLDDSIEKSYGELTEQLSLALGCEGYQREAAMVCGYTDECRMDPRTYMEIKLDAVRRARDILLHEESRREYDEMLGRYGNEGRGGGLSFRDGRGAVGCDELSYLEDTACEIYVDTPSVLNKDGKEDEEEEEEVEEEEEEDVWSYLDGEEREGDNDVKYGSHGNYSYETDDDTSYRDDEDQQNKDDTSGQRVQYHHHSPTDQNEFDLLMENCLEEEEYFKQLPPSKRVISFPPVIPPRLPSPSQSPHQQQHNGRRENHGVFVGGKYELEPKKDDCEQHDDAEKDDFVFDPFNLLRDGDIKPFLIKNGHIGHAPEDIWVDESLSYVCPLPSREDEDGDEAVNNDTKEQEDGTIKTDGSSIFDDVDDIKTSGSSIFDNVDDVWEDSHSHGMFGSNKTNKRRLHDPQPGLSYDSLRSQTNFSCFDKVSLEEVFGTPNNIKFEKDRSNIVWPDMELDCFGSHEDETKSGQDGDGCLPKTSGYQELTIEAFRGSNFFNDDNKLKKKKQRRLKEKVRNVVKALRVGSRNKGSKDSRSINTEEQIELEETEVQRLLMIASAFNKLNATTAEKQLAEFDIFDDDGDDLNSSHSSGSYYSEEESDENEGMIVARLMNAIRSMSKGSEEMDDFDCFPAEMDDHNSVRFQEFEYSSDDSASEGRYGSTPIKRKPEFFPCLDVLFDSVCKTTDDAINAVENFFWIPDDL